MKRETTLDYRHGKTLDAKKIFLICALILMYCPFFYTDMIGNYVGDAAIQIKIGLDCLSSGRFVPVEIYSWHEGLNWWPHEIGWYYIVGAAYKVLGLAGVILVTATFNYAIAGIAFKKYKDTVHPLVIVASAAIARLFTFPNYNARPHLFSELAFLLVIYVMLSTKKSQLFKSLFFCGAVFALAWVHGGMVPLLFAVYAVFVVIELIFRQFKTALIDLATAAGAFICSLLNPLGIKVWAYALVQSDGKDVWKYNIEWAPKTFEIWEIALLLLIIVAFIVDGRVKKFDKDAITRLCIFCLFIIISCKYCRFMNFTALFILALCTEELQSLIIWLNSNILHINREKIRFSNASFYILSGFCILFFGFTTVFSIVNYIPTNTMSDSSAIAAYDEGVISCLKQKGYKRIYNSFNTGTWLAFYGIPVHIDNRSDLYMASFSGTDYISGQMMIDNIADMDKFVDKYDCDAVVLDLLPGTTDEWFADDLYSASDRYKVIYDNTVTSVYKNDISTRWLVVECLE
ncbi:MAG: hypothetical protein IJK83_06240 [Clostridiales bacterium]|nr:hypothetical protein [Clostridiales bacterium]